MALAAVTDYPSLVLHLSEYLVRNDLEDYYPNWIKLAEGRLNSIVKHIGMQATATLTLANGNPSMAMPSGYIDAVRMSWTDGARTIGVRNVEPNAPEVTNRFRPNGPPQFFTVVDDQIMVFPPRSGSYSLVFYGRVPPLTAGSPTNWLIQQAPQLYVYAVLAEAYNFVKDDPRSSKLATEANERLIEFVSEAASGKVGTRATRAAEDAAEMNAAKAMV